MKKLEFKPEDFPTGTAEHSAEIANERLAEMLEEAPVVYGGLTNGNICYRWYAKKWAGRFGRTTHRAKLVAIEKIGN